MRKRVHNQGEYATDGNQRFSVVPAIAVADGDLSHSAFRTLCALGVFGDKQGWCWPSLGRLAAMLHKSRQAVSKDIQTLKGLGYIEVYEQFSGNVQQVNRIRILFDGYKLQVDTYKDEIERVSTPEIDRVSTSVIDQNAPFNAPFNESTQDAFSDLKNLIEHLTGYLSNPKDIDAIREMITLEVIEDDIKDALAFFTGNGKVARGAAHILTSVKRARAARLQKTNSKKAINQNESWKSEYTTA